MKIWIADAADFVGRHWGDMVGAGLLLVGTGLLVLYARMTGDWSEIKTVGAGLVLAAMGILKLRNVPKNGNGNGTPVAP